MESQVVKIPPNPPFSKGGDPAVSTSVYFVVITIRGFPQL